MAKQSSHSYAVPRQKGSYTPAKLRRDKNTTTRLRRISPVDGTFCDAIKIIVDKIKAHGYIPENFVTCLAGPGADVSGPFFSESKMKERGWFRWSVQRSEKVLIALL